MTAQNRNDKQMQKQMTKKWETNAKKKGKVNIFDFPMFAGPRFPNDNQIENLTIAKNCQKGPRAARNPIHPRSGVETCAWGGPASPWNLTLNTVLISRSKEMNKICRSRKHTREQEPSCSEGNSFRTLKTNSGQQTADYEEPIFLILRICMEWTSK